MKTIALFPMFLFFAVLAPPAVAQDTTKTSLLQSKADQESIRKNTDLLAGKIQDLVDELAANGISGGDAKVLQTTKTILGNLSAQEMQKVIDSLQKASETAGTNQREQSLVAAHIGQQNVIEIFRQVLKDYELRQAASELPGKFKELTDRQVDVMFTTATVGTGRGGINPSEQNTFQQTTQQIVQADQATLANDVAAAKQLLDKAAQDSTGDEGQALQQAETDFNSGALQAALDAANADLQAGHLLEATSQQKIAATELRKITKDLNPPGSLSEQLADFAGRLNKLIEEQKDLLGQTNAAAAIQTRVMGLDGKEGTLVYNTDALQQDMQSTSPTAAGLVKDAIMPMQVARRFLGPNGGSFAQAGSSEQDAIDKLLAAQEQLNQDLDKAQEKENEANTDPNQKPEDPKNPPDPSALANANSNLEKAETETGNALTDTTPQGGPQPPPQGAPDPSLTDAEHQLKLAGDDTDKAAQTPGLPDDATSAIGEAQQEIAKGQVSARNGDAKGTAGHAAAAQASLAQAKAAVSVALAGMTPGGQPMAGRPQQGQPGFANQPPRRNPSKTFVSAEIALGGRILDRRPLHPVSGNGVAVAYPKRNFGAVLEYEREAGPQEFSPMIDQYMKNLSDQSSSSPSE